MTLLAAARAAHENLMTDVCWIQTSSQGSFNDATGTRTDVSATVYYGKCRVRHADPTQAEAGERRNVVTAPTLHLPADDTTVIPERATVTVVSSTNPNLEGAEFFIVAADLSSTATARRFTMERRS